MKYALCLLGISLLLVECSREESESLARISSEDEIFTEMLPSFVQENIKKDRAEFLQSLHALNALPRSLLWLVDQGHPLPRDYTPPDLVSLDSYQQELVLNKNGMELSQHVVHDLIAMTKKAAEAGILLDISSAYRSFAYQEQIYRRAVQRDGYLQASKEVASPGTSQHQLGTTVDFGSISPEFAKSPAGKWLAAHAWEFGFSLSYPEGYEWLTGYVYESWHYRYVGKMASHFIHRYFNDMQHYFLVYWSQHSHMGMIYE